MWAYRSVTLPLTFFDFTVSRERAGPDLVLATFSGKLLADCSSGYQQIELHTDGRIERAACAAHARRKVLEARDNYPREASIVLAKFQQLYDIEDRGKVLSPEERLQLRQTEALPVWDALGDWLNPSSTVGVVVLAGPRRNISGGLLLLFGFDESIAQLKNSQSLSLNAGDSASVEIIPLIEILLQRCFGCIPTPEVVEPPLDFLGPTSCRMSQQRKIGIGFRRLRRLDRISHGIAS